MITKPTSYTPELLEKALDYVTNCPDLLPTVVGLILHIGIARATLYRWLDEGEKEEIAEIVSHISCLQEKKLIEGGLTSEFNPAITKMLLVRHGYADKTETDITTKGQSINTWTVNPVTTVKNAEH